MLIREADAANSPEQAEGAARGLSVYPHLLFCFFGSAEGTTESRLVVSRAFGTREEGKEVILLS